VDSEQDLLAAAYAAFNRRDIDAVLALMHHDVDWPNGMTGERVHGRENVRAYWTGQWSQVNPHVEPVSMHDEGGGKTLVEVHQVVRDLSGNMLVDQMVQHVYLIEEHLIVHMDIRRLSN
jgi:ketosteroid isomerase-like protein